jgi:DNA-binding response OmpR family regulator
MRILIVEDDHKLAAAMKVGIEHDAHVVDVIYTGNDVFDYIVNTKSDVIILDRMLPGKEGTEITRELRSKEIHIPILMLTAKGQVEDRVSGLDSGVDDYLLKPFAFSELMARIRALGRRPKHSDSTILHVADLQMNINTLEVKRGEKIIELSGKEFALLEFFMRHPGNILTKEQIMTQVWNYDAEVMPNLVEVYINHLRNKIDGVNKGKPLIKTIRGLGYKISE